MKVGDLVKYEADLRGDPSWPDNACPRTGVIIAELPADTILAEAVSVLWASGELVERIPPRILEVISESR